MRKFKKRAPRQQYPRAEERRYYRALRSVLDMVHEAVVKRVKPRLAELAAEQPFSVRDGTDHADAPTRAGAVVPKAMFQIIDGIKHQATKTLKVKAPVLAESTGWALNAQNSKEVTRQVQSLIGVTPWVSEPWLGAEVTDFTKANVALIESLSNQYLDEVNAVVSEGMLQGRRWEDLADDIEKRYGVSKSRAALIARDQVSKFVGDLTHQRQVGLGITKYTWRTSGDERVRDSHAALDGQTFSWDDPPVVDEKTGRKAHPGGDYQCRCTAEPDIDSALEDIEERETIPGTGGWVQR